MASLFFFWHVMSSPEEINGPFAKQWQMSEAFQQRVHVAEVAVVTLKQGQWKGRGILRSTARRRRTPALRLAATVASSVALRHLANLGIFMRVKTEAETKLTRLKGAARISAICVAHAVTSSAAQFCVLAAHMRMSCAFWLRGLSSFLDSAKLPVTVRT